MPGRGGDPRLLRALMGAWCLRRHVSRVLGVLGVLGDLGWVREFLNDENKGLDVLVNYLSFAQCAVMLDFEGLEGGEDGALEKLRVWSRSIEDLQHPSALPAPFASSLARSARQTALRYVPATLAGCRGPGPPLSGCALSLSPPRPPRRSPAGCAVRNGDSSSDFMVACMQFINIVVHSVEDMNFRVHLQYEFTKLGLEEFLQKSRHTESEKLQVQIQAYLDNVFDVGGLLEDAETKNVACRVPGHPLPGSGFAPGEGRVQGPRHGDGVAQGMVTAWGPMHRSQVAQGGHRTCPPAPAGAELAPALLAAIRIKKPIKTKFRLPVFNWTALKPNQISGTVFSELDDERVLEDLDLERFEELFKTKAQGPALDLVCAKNKASQKAASKVTLLEANRAKNLAITLRKAGRGAEEICRAIHTYVLLRRECGLHENSVLRAFLAASEGKLERLQKDARTAEDAYNTVVRYFGESPKTTPPSVFFPVFVRFIRSYKDAEQENETRKKQEEVMREKLLAQEAWKQDPASPSQRNKWQQQELIAELRRRQAKDHRPVYEGKDGTIEDIITARYPGARLGPGTGFQCNVGVPAQGLGTGSWCKAGFPARGP
ncbi:PREDICTED: formin-like protein 3 [Aptenodytes forsteri]|uniref:formin-like protein 3 n=1 Tax=Aptenodytes forsteri TaxID=9233 RepID=UPI0004F45B6F|nr:PREDICTED: formin-like protein 3 [Aptenodytes forsteri]